MAVKHIPLRWRRQRQRSSSSFVVVIAVVAVMGAASDAMDLCKYSDLHIFRVRKLYLGWHFLGTYDLRSS